MPAARYWRIVGVETYAGGDLELSELHLYGASGRLDATATLTSSHAPIAGTLANLQDDSAATVCRFAGAAVRSAGFALVWDFGTGNTVDTFGLRLGASADQSAFMAGCVLQYSTDGAQWQFLAEFARWAWPGAGAYTDAPAVRDPYYANVSLLLHFDGADGSTTFTDVKGHTFAPDGNAQIDTAQSKFGGASGLFDGSGDYLNSPSSTDWALGTGDFTIELWVNALSTGYGALVGTRSGNGIDPILYLWSTGVAVWYWNGAARITGATNLVSAGWKHVAVSRSAGSTRLFVDGVQEGITFSDSANYGANGLWVGSNPGDSQHYHGWLDELRITKGVARYTANFTPPTDPFPNTAWDVGGTVFAPPTLHTADSAVQIASSAPVPTFSTRRAAPLQMARDVEHGGLGIIYGTVKEKNTPANTPLRRKVWLMDERSGLVIRETWSDAATGAYEFRGIKQGVPYTVLAYDHVHNYRAVIADNLLPEVLP